jgi:hypothetical protein
LLQPRFSRRVECSANAAIPVAVNSQIVRGTTDAAARNVLLLGNIAHCTKFKIGKFQIGAAILSQREGNLRTTRIPDTWRQP